jgi:signal transduction histidine kinase/HAMP domain-containing protein
MTSGWSIRHRIIITVVLLTTLLVGLTTFIILQSNAAAIRAQREIAIFGQSEAFALQLDEQFQQLAETPLLLAEILNDPAFSPVPALRRTASSIMQNNPTIERIHILRPYREGFQEVTFRRSISAEILAPMADNYLAEAPDFEWLNRTLNEGGVQWGAITSPDSLFPQQYVIAVPYQTTGEPRTGVVWIEINAHALREQIQNIIRITPDGDYHMMLAPSGVVGMYGLPAEMASSAGEMTQELMLSQEQLQSLLIQFMGQADGVTEASDPLNMRAGSAYIISSTLQTNNWRLVSVYAPGTLQNPQNQSALFALLVALAGLVTLAFIVRNMVERLISQPLSTISAAAREIGGGDMRYHISHTERPDEVGTLARSLSDMQKNLVSTYGKLADYGHTLEKRVTERTQQLDDARQIAQDNAAELRSLYDASIEIVSEYQLEMMLQKMVSYVRTLLRAGYCSVWLLNEDGRQLRLVATTPEHRHIVGVVITANEGLAGRVIRARKGMIVDDYTNWTGRIGWIMPQMHRAVAVPLIYSGRAIGAVIAGRGPLDRPFEEADQRLLNLLANVVSPIVRNAQLFAQLEETKQRAENANDVKTRFLAGITHELRTPLNLVINNMDFMRIGVFGEVNDEQRERLDQTIRSAENLLYLINDLLDVSKIEAGEMEMFFQPGDLTPILVDTLDAALAMIPEDSPVALMADFPETLPELSIDARRIRQVLLNLLGNAIKFTRKGEIWLRVAVKEDMVEFSVSDTGMGIPKNEIEAIFQPFERATHAKQMGIEGTGLGLPISRYLIAAHGGELKVKSETGKGSTFYFSLPLAKNEKRRTGMVKAVI